MYRYDYKRENSAVYVYEDSAEVARLDVEVDNQVASLRVSEMYKGRPEGTFNKCFELLSRSLAEVKKVLNSNGLNVEKVRISSISEVKDYEKNIEQLYNSVKPVKTVSKR